MGRCIRSAMECCLLAAVLFGVCRGLALRVENSAKHPGVFQIVLDGKTWLETGDIAFRHGNRTHSLRHGSLQHIGVTSKGHGHDGLGSFEYEREHWATAEGVRFVTGVRRYAGIAAVAFEQEFPDGANDTQVQNAWRCKSDLEPWGAPVDAWLACDVVGLTSAFPSFKSEPSKADLGFMQFVGAHIEDCHNGTHRGPWLGRWGEQTPATGLSAGPLSVFNRSGATIVLGPMEAFMASSMDLVGQDLQFGVVGSARGVPRGFKHSVLLYAGNNLIPSWRQWGNALLTKYGTKRQEDFTTLNLGYQTDNGAYYYYEPEVAKALVEEHRDSVHRHIPYRFAHLDSWWYWKSNQSMGGGGVPLGGGVLNWTAMPSVFPGGNQGIQQLHNTTGWPFMAHNRWWSNQTQYAESWNFLVEKQSTTYPDIGMALPLEGEFWEFLFSQAQSWGLETYEQDWLWTQYLGTNAALEDVTVGRRWLMEMGKAAESKGVSVMYCMALPRMALQTAELPAVTQLRVSDDYGLALAKDEVPQQWRIGRSSLLADALGLKPFKDGFFSDDAIQVGGHARGKREPFPELQAAAATFSAGAVMPNDGAGFGNAQLIRRSCMADGRLLQPARAAVALGSSLIEEAFEGAMGVGLNRSEVWVATSLPGHIHILAADLQRPTTVSVHDLLADTDGHPGPLLAHSVGASGDARDLTYLSDTSATVELQVRTLPEFEVWHFAPVVDDAWAFLGELEKWVPTAPQRFQLHSSRRSASIFGALGEQVTLWVAERHARHHSSWTTRNTTCVVPASGSVEVQLPSLTCVSHEPFTFVV